jgi:hypothetical protein
MRQSHELARHEFIVSATIEPYRLECRQNSYRADYKNEEPAEAAGYKDRAARF